MEKPSYNIILRVMYFFLGITIFVVPIVFVPNSIFFFATSRTFFFLFFTEIMTLLYLLLIFLYPEYIPKKNYILFGFLSFLIISILSGIFGIDPIYSFWSGSMRADGIIVLIHLFLFFLVMISTIRSKKTLNLFIWISVLSSICVTLSIYLCSSGFNIIKKLPGGLLSNDSYAGVYLLFNLFFIIYLYFEDKNRKIRYFLLVFLFFILFSPTFFNFNIFRGIVSLNDLINNPILIIGNARGAAISFILGLILTFFLMFVKHTNKLFCSGAKIATSIFLTFLIIIIIFIFSSNNSLNDWFNKKTGGFRDIYRHQALEGFKAKPILGWGPGTFQNVNTKYFNPVIFNYSGTEVFSDKVHNVIFEVLVCTGILGLIFYLSIFVLSIYTLWWSINIGNHTKAILTGLIFAYFLQNLIFFDVLVSYLMFVFLLAIIVILDNDFKEINLNDVKLYKNILYIIVPIFLIITGFILIRYFVFLPFKKVHEDYNFYTLEPGIRGSLYREKPTNISPFGKNSDLEQYSLVIYDQYTYNLDLIKKQKDLVPYITDLDGIIEENKKLYENKKDTFLKVYLIYRFYEIKYKLIGDNLLTLKNMEEYSQKEMNLSPNDPRGYVDFANVLSYKKEYLRSLEILEQAYNLAPANKEINLLIINTAVKTGNKELVKEKIKRAQENLYTFEFKFE